MVGSCVVYSICLVFGGSQIDSVQTTAFCVSRASSL